MGNERGRLRLTLIFVALYGCILIRLQPTPAKTIFRLTLIAVGIGGLA